MRLEEPELPLTCVQVYTDALRVSVCVLECVYSVTGAQGWVWPALMAYRRVVCVMCDIWLR